MPEFCIFWFSTDFILTLTIIITISIRYHVPRSWLQPTKNVLVLLEEVGGDPTGISLRKRQVDTVCAHVSQDHPTGNSSTSPELRLQCSSGQHISSISFASFGNPTGYCGNFIKGSHDAGSSTSLVENVCTSSFIFWSFMQWVALQPEEGEWF